MATSDFFAISINHGGRFSCSDNLRFYIGGTSYMKHGLDLDRFGFLDLVEIVEELGYVSWDRLWCRIPITDNYVELLDDKGVMCMLGLVSAECRCVHVFVEGAKSLEDVSVSDKELVGGTKSVVNELLINDARNHASEGTKNVDWYIPEDCEGDEDGDKQRIENGEGDMNGNGLETNNGEGDIWSEGSSEYNPSDDELSDVSLGSVEGISDEEYVEIRKNIRRVKNVFDLIDSFDGFEQYVGEEPISDYEIADADSQSSDSDDAFDFIKQRQKKVVYDPKCDHKNMEIVLGMHFEDGLQCSSALTTWAIENGRFIRFRCVRKTKLVAYCTPQCPWKVYASIVQSNKTFIIKSYAGDHDCPKSMNNKLVSSKWIANRYLNVFRVRYNLSIKDLRADILHRFKTRVLKDKLYKAKKIAHELVRGSIEAHYASMRSYVAELRRADNEGRYELLLGDEGQFKALYIGLSALRKAFLKSCRPVIGLDGCHLKTYLGGVLMCAVGKDGNNGMFPIAWAVVEIENEACWTWFLKCVVEDLGIADGHGWSFTSDQQKEIENAVAKLVPQVEHRNCARHIYMNWKKTHKGSTLENLYWGAVNATFLEDFKVAIQKMKSESPAAYEDFMARDTKKFCKAFLSTLPCSDSINNNISETFNSYIVKARGKHVIHMLEDIRYSLMVRQVEKFKEMSKVTSSICPNIRQALEKLRIESADCTPHLGMFDKFEVHYEADKFVVDVKHYTCSCRGWDLTGIPCIHAISTIQEMEMDPVNYVNDYYSMSRYMSGYEFGIEPIRGNKMWPEVDGVIVKPPQVRKMPGRPKKKRIRAPEEKKCGKKLSKHGGIIKCSTCKQEGHNKRKCKNEPVQSDNVQKRKRGRPAKLSEPKDKQHASTSRARRQEGKTGESTSRLHQSGVTNVGTTQESSNVDGQ